MKAQFSLKNIFFKVGLGLNLLLIITGINLGQKKTGSDNIGKTFLTDFSSAVTVGFNTAERPLRFSQSDWVRVGAVTFGTAALFLADKSVRSFALSNQNDFNNNLFGFDKFYGSGYTALFTAGIYGAGLFSGNDDVRKLGLYSSEAFVISGIGAAILKVILGRRRPYKGESNLFFNPFTLIDNDFHSLPSGHTTVAFAVSEVMAESIDNIYWKSLWYGAAGLTALSRIYHNQHWASDVFLGAVIGYYVGQFVTDVNKNKRVKTSHIRISPLVSFNGMGITVSF